MSGEASGFATGGKHAMAGDDEGNGIPAQGAPHGASGGGLTQGRGKVGVGDSLSHRDFASGLVYLPDKKTCPVQVHRDVTKVLKLALQVFA
jgi:hypothetical protein